MMNKVVVVGGDETWKAPGRNGKLSTMALALERAVQLALELGDLGARVAQLRLALHLPQRAVLGLFELVGAAGDARARESRTQIERHDDDGDGLPLLHAQSLQS